MTNSDSELHLQIIQSLPWYATGHLPNEESVRIEEHLNRCEECRREYNRELELQRRLDLLRKPQRVAPESYAQLERRILDAASRGEIDNIPAQMTRRARTPAARATLMRWAAIVSGVAILGGFAATELMAPRYVTMSAAPVPAPRGTQLRLIMAPRVPIGAMAAWLRSQGAQVVAGPGADDVWTVALPQRLDQPAIAATLAKWRARPDIELVEPVTWVR